MRKDLRARVNPKDPSSETAATKRMLKLLGDKYTQVGGYIGMLYTRIHTGAHMHNLEKRLPSHLLTHQYTHTHTQQERTHEPTAALPLTHNTIIHTINHKNQLLSPTMYTEMSRFDPIGAGFMLSIDDDGYFTVSSDPRVRMRMKEMI